MNHKGVSRKHAKLNGVYSDTCLFGINARLGLHYTTLNTILIHLLVTLLGLLLTIFLTILLVLVLLFLLVLLLNLLLSPILLLLLVLQRKIPLKEGLLGRCNIGSLLLRSLNHILPRDTVLHVQQPGYHLAGIL
jgi:hypothetical protein